MPAAPRVTVLMALYNAERYLPEAITSLLAQDLADFEILVVDDASTDGGPRYLQSVADPRLRVVRNDRNRDVPYSRQRGLALARGSYIAILDADDVACPGRLSIQVAYLDAHPEVAVVGTAFEIINSAGRRLGVQDVPDDWLTLRWHLLFGNGLGNSTVMFRRSAVEAVGGYDERVLTGEDYDLWVRLVGRGMRISQLKQPLARWRLHAESYQARLHSESFQATASASIKRSLIETVARSITTRTGLLVSLEVARVLYRDQSYRTREPLVLRQAYATIRACAEYFASHVCETAAERAQIAELAQKDIFRLARRHPASLMQGSRLTAALAWQYDRTSLVDGRLVAQAARELCLNPLRRWLWQQRLRRPLPAPA